MSKSHPSSHNKSETDLDINPWMNENTVLSNNGILFNYIFKFYFEKPQKEGRQREYQTQSDRK